MYVFNVREQNTIQWRFGILKPHAIYSIYMYLYVFMHVFFEKPGLAKFSRAEISSDVPPASLCALFFSTWTCRLDYRNRIEFYYFNLIILKFLYVYAIYPRISKIYTQQLNVLWSKVLIWFACHLLSLFLSMVLCPGWVCSPTFRDIGHTMRGDYDFMTHSNKCFPYVLRCLVVTR